MDEIRKFNAHDKAVAWWNSGGNLNDFNQPVGTLKCPYEECLYPDILMKANDFGDEGEQWTIVYLIPEDQDGIYADANLEAIHMGCSKLNGDKVIHVNSHY